MRVTRRRLPVFVPEQPADDRQAKPGASANAGVSMAQIMDARVFDLRVMLNQLPRPLQIGRRRAGQCADRTLVS